MFCIILQGLPGSGKSKLAKIIASMPDVIVCSADDYFVDKATGVYQWDLRQLKEAHDACSSKFIKSVNSRYNVVVDNTNTLKRDYYFYDTYAKEAGYEVIRIEVKTDLTDKELSERNVHKVPIETISRMRKRLNGF